MGISYFAWLLLIVIVGWLFSGMDQVVGTIWVCYIPSFLAILTCFIVHLMFLKVDIISHVILWYTGNKLFFWKHLVHLISKRISLWDQFKQNWTQLGSTAHVFSFDWDSVLRNPWRLCYWSCPGSTNLHLELKLCRTTLWLLLAHWARQELAISLVSV